MFIDSQQYYEEDLQVFLRDGFSKNDIYKTSNINFSIIIFLNGRFEIKSNSNLYLATEGDILFLSHTESYSIKPVKKNSSYLVLSFSPSIINMIDPKKDILQPFRNRDQIKIIKNALFDEDNPHFSQCLDNVMRALDTHASRSFVYSSVLQFICEIAYCYNPTTAVLDNYSNKYIAIITYIENHIYEKITLKDVSENTFLSVRNIQNIIKKEDGMTYSELILKLRFKHVEGKLKHSNSSVESIAKKMGFNSYSAFYRAFKKTYGMSPNEYRKQSRIEKR